uniref:HTH CENPB-type domain-containing protein n=1 Tax=Daphnia galeata TaxID=27404 RepID=A0A8J2RNC4_9CRUS|nr:unnamed protein product [Daphnia galeata]
MVKDKGKTRNCLSLDLKIKVIGMLKEGLSERAIAASVGASKSQVHRISASKETLVQLSTNNPSAKIMANLSKNQELDKAVLQWFNEMRNPRGRLKPLSLSRAIIQARALHEAKLRGIADFKASDGWFRNWRKRYGIGKSLRLHGEAADVNIQETEPKIEIIRQKLTKYKTKNVFNMDKSGLFYLETYVSSEEGDRTRIRGSKTLRAKDRVTLILCVNADGSCKIPPVIVGSAKNPDCFRDSPSPIPYLSQRNAWVDRDVYSTWWFNIFLPVVRSFTTEPVVLLMDNCSGHDMALTDPEGQVEVILFPPNCTSVYQPLDQGIISALKTLYKREMLAEFVEAYGKYEELQRLASEAKKGRKGLKVGCSANFLDVGRIVKKCWDSLPRKTIVGCWLHSKCLPHLPSELGPSEDRQTIQRNAAREICEIFSNLSFDTFQEKTDPEIIAAGEIELINEISLQCDSSASEEHLSVTHVCTETMDVDIPVPDISSPTSELTLSEETIKRILLKYACVAIRSGVKDPITLALSEGIRSHLF